MVDNGNIQKLSYQEHILCLRRNTARNSQCRPHRWIRAKWKLHNSCSF